MERPIETTKAFCYIKEFTTFHKCSTTVLSMNKCRNQRSIVIVCHSHEWLILQIEQTRTPPNGILGRGTWAKAQVEVSTLCHRQVTSGSVTFDGLHASCEVASTGYTTGTDTIQRGINGFGHARGPILPIILGDIDSTTVGRHFSFTRTQGDDDLWLTGQFSWHGDLFPTLTAILGVEKQWGLAHNPYFITIHGDRLKTITCSNATQGRSAWQWQQKYGPKYAKVRICDLQISTRKLGVLTKEVIKRYISFW